MAIPLPPFPLEIAYVCQGAALPEALRLTAANYAGDLDPLDFTRVTSAQIRVEQFNGAFLLWDVTVQSVTTDLLTIYHTFAADGSDVPSPGRFGMQLLCTVSGVVAKRSFPFTLIVFSRFPGR